MTAPARKIADVRHGLAAAVAYGARRMWRHPHREADDDVILDLLVEALDRM